MTENKKIIYTLEYNVEESEKEDENVERTTTKQLSKIRTSSQMLYGVGGEKRCKFCQNKREASVRKGRHWLDLLVDWFDDKIVYF